jgi:hypothetical protein
MLMFFMRKKIGHGSFFLRLAWNKPAQTGWTVSEY